MSAFGAIDLFSGSSSITGSNLFTADKNPLNEISEGIEDVIGDQATSAGGQVTALAQALINAILGIPLDILEGAEEAGNLLGINSFFGNIEDFFGGIDFNLADFDPVTAIENFVTTMLNPSTWFTNLSSMLGGIDFTLGDFDPVTAVETFITDIINPTNLLAPLEAGLLPTNVIPQLPMDLITGLEDVFGGIDLSNTNPIIAAIESLGTDVSSIVEGIFGVPGGSDPLATLTTLGSNLMAMLGVPDLNTSSGTFDPISAVEQFFQNVATPAGALTTSTPIPAHLFGNLSVGAASANLLPDPSFNDSTSLNGSGLWTWDGTVDHTGTAGSGSAKTTAAGVLRELIGVPIPTVAGDITNLSAYLNWAGITATAGTAITLCANAYDASDNQISDPSNRVLASITTPGTTSVGHTGADAHGWVQLAGAYQAPTGTAYVRLCIEVAAVVISGSVWVDDCVQTLQSGIIDASILTNIENIPQLLGTSVAGFSGLTDLESTFQHILDGLGSAFSTSGSVSGIDFTGLFSLAQSSTSNTVTALEQAIAATLTLGQRTNKSTSAGTNPTSEAMFTIGHFSSGGAITTLSLTTGNSISQMFRASELATKGFVDILCSGTGTTGIYINIYSVDPTTHARALLWSSGDIHAQVPTALGYMRALIPSVSQPTVNPGDVLQIEVANTGTAALTIATMTTGAPNNTLDFPVNFGCTRVLASTGGAAPASFADTAVTYSGTLPYVNFGIQDVPANYHAPETDTYDAAGTYTQMVPTWMEAGDEIDVIGIGGGGGGGGSDNFIPGQGGGSAAWGAQTLVVGTDIAIGSIMTIVVGGRGAPGGIVENGGNGGTTTLTYIAPGGASHTITFAGGPYGGSGISNNPSNPVGGSGTGQAAADETYDTITYFGGAAVGAGSTGQSPGGGGGGAISYFSGASGGVGELNLFSSQTT